MRTCILFLLCIFGLLCCGPPPDQKSTPLDYFSAGQEQALLREIIKQTAKKAEGSLSAQEEEAWYAEQEKVTQWHFAHEQNGRFYYFISRPAPSLYGKRTGLGGSFSSPDRIRVSAFKEEFRTFKMKPADLLAKGAILFEKMVNREDLTPYQPGKRGEEEWIEFPDTFHTYDSTTRRWVQANPQ